MSFARTKGTWILEHTLFSTPPVAAAGAGEIRAGAPLILLNINKNKKSVECAWGGGRGGRWAEVAPR